MALLVFMLGCILIYLGMTNRVRSTGKQLFSTVKGTTQG